MKEVADKYFKCGEKCSMTDYGQMIKKVLNGGVVALMVSNSYFTIVFAVLFYVP